MKIDFDKITTSQLWEIKAAVCAELDLRSAQNKPSTAKGAAMSAAKRYSKKDDLDPYVKLVNSSLLLSFPTGPREQFDEKRVYLQCILEQDWSSLFASYENGSSNFYVYAHIDPRNTGFACEEINIPVFCGMPFYIGKGTGDRAFQLKRNQGHGKTIQFLLDRGHAPHSLVKIMFNGLSERAAMELEAKLIYFFGTIYEKGRKGILLNLDTSKRPEFLGVMHRHVTSRVSRLMEERKINTTFGRAMQASKFLDEASV